MIGWVEGGVIGCVIGWVERVWMRLCVIDRLCG